MTSKVRLAQLVAAVILLDASLAFENIWPTPAIRWSGTLSIELAATFLIMALACRVLGPPSRKATAWLATVWTLLVIGHYADVTAPALYGRDINLYWDLRFIPDVVAMVTRVAPVWLIVLSIAAVGLVLTLLYRVLRWAWTRVGEAMADARERAALTIVASAIAALFAVTLALPGVAEGDQPLTGQTANPPSSWFGDLVAEHAPAFATPVVRTYVRQIAFVVDAMSGSTALVASPPMDANLSIVRDADVFLVFLESYGAVSYLRPDIAGPLAASRTALASAIRDTHRDVVSAYVESPTFGGSSWLAHVSLLSGVEVKDPKTNALLMAQPRDTLVRAFGRAGFRTVGLMPGMRQNWPEGVFYGFDEIYGADRLAYRGPEFGWFAIPDQFSIERIDALEVSRPSRPPLFAFFPTISTHFPFSPTPPYQPNWKRMEDERPYDGPAIVEAYSHQPEWTDLSHGYVTAMSYDLDTIGGYLRLRPERDFVLILLGDHQPPAAVSGEGAPWDVPVHIVASRTKVIDRLLAHGFRRGLTPERPALAKMHALLPILLDVFSDSTR